MNHFADGFQKSQDFQSPPARPEAPMPDRDAALRQIQRLMEQWQLTPQELIDPAERQVALAKARRLVEFWQLTAEELEGPPAAAQSAPPRYRYTHPKTGESWDGLGPQPEWLRRCLLTEGYRLHQVRTALDMN